MEIQKMDNMELVFGLDIGTRNVVGTVGYRDEDEIFHVIAQYSKEHDTRSMLDGQIHDIRRVGKTIGQVKQHLEEQIEHPLTEVCIAAAGRVLKTVTTHVDYEYPDETVVTGEMIHTLELLGVEKAQGILREENDTKYRFYCVGYSVVKYYINDEVYSNLEGHKAEVMSADIIVTFLPEDVVDGLYTAVALADLEVANMTLEPIAAINVAIPESFRMLNIALVDVGAGTSDICITKDGSIIAYGMIPFAGDEITEVIVQHYLVDFKMAEHIKLSSTVDDEVEFEDIMSITRRVPAEEVWELTKPVVDKIAAGVAEKIIELNGDKTVSATFVVGGGGKVHGFVERLSEGLELPQERVALRGEQVLREIDFQEVDVEKDPLIVTPIGICLNYYEHKNNFIMVRFNGERIQLYDNNRLTVVDAALQAGFPNEYLFPRRGQAINFTVNGKQRMIRGEIGESSVVKMNGREVSINTALEPNCEIEIIPSTVGGDAAYTIEQLEEYTSSTITFEVNRKLVTCPRFVLVNGTLQPPTCQICEGDKIEVCSFYTVRQLAEFMDVELDADADILVNNRVENLSALIYENFSVDWTVLNYRTAKEDLLLPGETEAAGGADTGAAALLADARDGAEEDAAKETLDGAAVQKPESKQERREGTSAGESSEEAAAVGLVKSQADDRETETGISASAEDAPGERTEAPGREAGTPGMKAETADGEAEMPDGKAGTPDEEAEMPDGKPWTSDRKAETPDGKADMSDEKVEPLDGIAETSDGIENTSDRRTGTAGERAEAPDGRTETEGERADTSGGKVEEPDGKTEMAAERAETSGVKAEVLDEKAEEPDGKTEAPGERAETAGEKAETPDRKAETSDRKIETPYERAGTSDRKTETPYERAGTSDRKTETSYERADTSGGKTETAYGKADTSDRKTDMPGGRAETPDGKAETPDVKTETPDEKSDTPDGKSEASQKEAEAQKEEPSARNGGTPASDGDLPASEKHVSLQPKKNPDELVVFVNDETVVMHGKPEYVFIDVFDYIDFDLSDSRGRGIITQINEKNAYYTQTLKEGDRIVIRWEEKK